jgi:hypothetical protein
MSRKQRRSKVERERERERKRRRDDDVLVEDTVARVGCTVDTAEDMTGQCEDRLADIDFHLTFAKLALGVWRDQPLGKELVPLLEDMIVEQRRHAAVMNSLAERFQALSRREHEHLPLGAVDPNWVRSVIFAPPEDLTHQDVDRQIPTDSNRR